MYNGWQKGCFHFEPAVLGKNLTTGAVGDDEPVSEPENASRASYASASMCAENSK